MPISNKNQDISNIINDIETLSKYHQMIKNANGNNISKDYVGYIIVFFDDGSEVIIEKDLIVDNVSTLLNVKYTHPYINQPKVVSMKAFIDVKEFAKKIDAEVEELFSRHFK